MPTVEIVLVRSFLILIICAASTHVWKISPFWGKRKNLGLLLLRGVFGAAFIHSYYQAIAMLPLSEAVTLYFLSPTLTAVAAWMVLKEALSFVVRLMPVIIDK